MAENAKRNIFIIDDDPFILDMYVLKLKEQGFAVDTANDGRTGLEKIREQKPDVVLLDVVMPAMDGFEVLQAIKKDYPTPPPHIVFLTNFGQKEDIERGMELGAEDYIIKAHFTPSEVAEKVKSICRTFSLKTPCKAILFSRIVPNTFTVFTTI